jgi:cardiolipin synthase A/B
VGGDARDEKEWRDTHFRVEGPLVGSSNVNRRSLHHDEEVAMVVIDQASVDLLDHQFLEDLQRSRQLDLSRWQTRSAPQRTLEHGPAPAAY